MQNLTTPTAENFERTLSECCVWVEQQEHIILKSGVALTDEQQADAKRIGVTYPERVRLLRVQAIPSPPIPNAPKDVRGLAARYGIFIRANCWGKRRIVVHELVHTMQYERLGGIRQFLDPYLREFYGSQYLKKLMEQEAQTFANEMCGKHFCPFRMGSVFALDHPSPSL